MLNHLSNPETRYLSILGPAEAEEIEDYLFLEECESKARSLGDLDWLQRIERDFTPDQREALRFSP
jgi:hypothetical protein